MSPFASKRRKHLPNTSILYSEVVVTYSMYVSILYTFVYVLNVAFAALVTKPPCRAGSPRCKTPYRTSSDQHSLKEATEARERVAEVGRGALRRVVASSFGFESLERYVLKCSSSLASLASLACAQHRLRLALRFVALYLGLQRGRWQLGCRGGCHVSGLFTSALT